MRIKDIRAREILDSRGNPTVEAEVILKNNIRGVAAVPSGASTGKHEALELRDGDKKRYGGLGVLKAVNNIHQYIAPRLRGWRVTKQEKIDRLMLEIDGTPNKSNLGANAILAVSLAVARAAATDKRLLLYRYLRTLHPHRLTAWRIPTPSMNIINGGVHADSGLAVQEFMIVPQQKRVAEQVRCGAEVFHALKKLLIKDRLTASVGDEGGFAPHLGHNEQAFTYILKAIRAAGYQPGRDVKLAIDVAASEFYRKGMYQFESHSRSAADMVEIYQQWLTKYPVMAIEDGLAEDDWAAWQLLTKKLGKKIMLVGDDLFVTNVERLQRGIAEHVANAILIKVNQIGTLSETLQCIALAQSNHYKVMISHRSGETADDFIADLAVAVNAEYLKSGSLSRSERVGKYNRLIAIEKELL